MASHACGRVYSMGHLRKVREKFIMDMSPEAVKDRSEIGLTFDEELELQALHYERHINEIYSERNRLVSLVMRMCQELNLSYGLKRDPHPPQDGWDYIAFFDLPSGQCSFHIPNTELSFFAGMPAYPDEWDHHTTYEKYARILAPTFGQQGKIGGNMRSWGLDITQPSSSFSSSTFSTHPLVEIDKEKEE